MAARVVKVLKNGWEMDHIPMKNFERHGDEVLKLFNAKFKTEEEEEGNSTYVLFIYLCQVLSSAMLQMKKPTKYLTYDTLILIKQ